MRILQINSFGNLSTGRIAADIDRILRENGHEGKVAYARNIIAEDVSYMKIGNIWSVCADGIMTRLTDRAGFYSKTATKRLVKAIMEYNPDVIHLHNLHGYYINIRLLFEYLNFSGKPVVWTLHDCWAFTGHCCYYSLAGCSRWKRGCHDCPQKNAYPKSFTDHSEWNYRKKKELFTSVPGLHLAAVSKWLAGEIKQSFLKKLPCTVIYNGVDTDIFQPTKSDIREKYKIQDKFMILGVASTWDVRKGLQDFIKLAGILDESYAIVLVGVTDREKNLLPKNIIGISRTDHVKELAGIYSAADVFFNASAEETFGLPTAEAIACGTPAIVYRATALPEVISQQNGFVTEKGDLNKVKQIIEKMKAEQFIVQGNLSNFEAKRNYLKYIDLYQHMMK